jgi:hypothetical protein
VALASSQGVFDVLMAGGVVGGEDVAAEVAVRVAPHGVDVVGVALRVVVFGEQPRALDPVVIR